MDDLPLPPPSAGKTYKLAKAHKTLHIAKAVIEYVLLHERKDLVFKITVMNWNLDDCRSHPCYFVTHLEWLMTVTGNISPDNYFLCWLNSVLPAKIRENIHPTLKLPTNG